MLFTILVTFAKVKFCFITWLKSQFSILGRIPKDTERFSRHFSTKSAPAQTRRTRTQSFHWNDLKINLWDIYHIFVKNELKCPLIISKFFVRPKKVSLFWKMCLFGENELILGSGGFRILTPLVQGRTTFGPPSFYHCEKQN